MGGFFALGYPYDRDSNQLHRFSSAPSRGHVPRGGVFDALRDAGYHGWLTIERFGSADGLTRSKQRVAA
jgi:sugar phosphate isomerase/epimerase